MDDEGRVWEGEFQNGNLFNEGFGKVTSPKGTICEVNLNIATLMVAVRSVFLMEGSGKENLLMIVLKKGKVIKSTREVIEGTFKDCYIDGHFYEHRLIGYGRGYSPTERFGKAISDNKLHGLNGKVTLSNHEILEGDFAKGDFIRGKKEFSQMAKFGKGSLKGIPMITNLKMFFYMAKGRSLAPMGIFWKEILYAVD